jgi:hypothetical protein
MTLLTTSIRPCHDFDKPFLRHVAKKLTDSIGFLPEPALDRYIHFGQCLICEENSDEAGFLIVHPQLKIDHRVSAILQAAVCLDARRRHHGLSMLETAENVAKSKGRSIMQCWCAADLPANDFWRAAGYRPICQRSGGKRRDRNHILWRKALDPEADLSLIITDPRRGPGGIFVPIKPALITQLPLFEPQNLRIS